MKSKLIFILWLLMFSFFSCDFGIKENEETNSKEYFTVKGSCSIQGAIPSDLFPEKSIKQNAQRTVVPSIIKTDSLEITVNFVESNTNEKIPANVVNDDGVFKFEVELPAGKWTAQAEGKSKNNIIIQGKSEEFELSAEKTNANVAVILKPIQSENGQGTFKFSFGQNHTKVSGMKYTYKKHGESVETSKPIDEFNNTITIQLSSGVYTFKFDFYSNKECEGELLYSFTEVVNIFDGLTTDTWIGAGEYIDEGKICINDTMISKFVSTTVYVSTAGDDTNLGTFFAPVNTIQKAVDKVIDMNVVTASSEGNPYKILLLSDIETSSNDSFESNKALVNIDPSSASSNGNPLYLTISKCGDGNATINAKRTESDTGRVMYIGENANVTLENLKITGGYLADDTNNNNKGSGLYILNNGSTVKIKNCEISNNTIKNGSGAGICVGYNTSDKQFSLSIENSKINNNRIEHYSSVQTFSGAGIQIENVAANITIKNSEISNNIIDQKDTSANSPSAQGIGFWLGNNATTTISSTSIKNNLVKNPTEDNENAGGGIYIKGGKLTINDGTEIINNKSTNGGGIYGANGTIIMNNTTISENKVASVNDVEGAGVCLHGANLTMNGGLISENECYSNYSSSGGGVYINNSSTFTMTSGEISENSAKYGGGVSVSGGTFIMEGGSISTNTVTENGKGKGVYVVKSNNTEPTFKISGNASITEDNDVYLTADQKITITGELTSDSVATITPENYAENSAENPAKKVKVLDTVNDITLSEQRTKFNVTQSDKFKTEITDEGCLKNTIEATELDENLYDICSTINVSSANGMTAISNLSQKNGEEAGKTFKGKTIILEDNIELTSDYMLIKTFSGVFDGNNKTITLNKPETYHNGNYFGGAIFNVITGKDAEVSDLNVEGEAYIAGIAIDLKNYAVISNCNNYAKITSPDGNGVPACGGIVGELSNEGFIENCINYGTISYNSTNYNGCGGIVGEISSYSSPETGDSSDFGNSIIANCINKGEIERVQKEGGVENNVSIGGICGEVTGNAAIYNCVNTGSVTSKLTAQDAIENIGGITGYCSVSFYEGEFPSFPDDMGIFNCYNSGEISSRGSSDLKYIGGIVGKGEVYFSSWVYHTIRVTNTVNNDDATFSVGNINILNNSVEFDITNNYYKKDDTSSNYPYESTFANDIDSAINTLNAYSDNSGRKYLTWGKDSKGNIVFSKDISDNQGITP